MVVRRGRAPSAGLWSIPGGRVEPPESLLEAVCREVREETGIEVRVVGLAGRVELAAADPAANDENGAGICYDVTDFYVTPVDATAALVAGDDAIEARWVTRDELDELSCTPGLLDTLTGWGVWSGF